MILINCQNIIFISCWNMFLYLYEGLQKYPLDIEYYKTKIGIETEK